MSLPRPIFSAILSLSWISLVAATASAATVRFTNNSAAFVDPFTNGGTAIANVFRDFEVTAGDFTPGETIVDQVAISISFAKHAGNFFIPRGSALPIGPGFFDEIEFALTSPTGTTVKLVENASPIETFLPGTTSFRGTILFDQDVFSPVDVNGVPTAGTFRPDDGVGNLDDFNGESALGTWQLLVQDNAFGDGLSFYEAELFVGTVPASAVIPEPTTLTLAAVAGCGLAATRRRRRR